jgi:hypothetical protein
MKNFVGPMLMIAVLFGTGCFRLGGPDAVSQQLSREAGVELDQEFGFTVTRGGVWLAKKSLRWVDDVDVSLDGLRRVEIGVYTVRDRDESRAGSLGEHLFPAEWSTWVHVQDDDSEVFVMVKQGETPEQIRGMLIVVAEDEEWVVVSMKGKLEKVLEDALRFAFDQTDRPDLYEKTREERDLPPLGDMVDSADIAQGMTDEVGD